jgi:hypothetical protein
MSSSEAPGEPSSIQIREVKQVAPSERKLVEWVAAGSGEMPEPWSYAMKPEESVLRTLVGVGVIRVPAPGADQAALIRESGDAAKAWLEQNPAEPPA